MRHRRLLSSANSRVQRRLACSTNHLSLTFRLAYTSLEADSARLAEQRALIEHVSLRAASFHVRLCEVPSLPQAPTLPLLPPPPFFSQKEAQLRAREEALEQQLQSRAFASDTVVRNSVSHAIQVGKIPLCVALPPCCVTPVRPQVNPVRLNFSLITLKASPFSSSHIPARSWTVENVVAWMSVLEAELSQYAPLFGQNDINGQVLLNLTNDTLRDELGIRSYGHRQRLLGEIHNIQRSTDFPPLSASRLAGGRRASASERQRVELRLVLTYVHDVKRHSWRVLLAPEMKIANDYLSQVDFVLSMPEAGRNEVQVTSKAPFEYCGLCDPAEGAELTFTVHFRQHEFRRSLVQHALRIDGRERREIVVARLLPRPAMRQQVFSVLPPAHPGVREGVTQDRAQSTVSVSDALASGYISPPMSLGAHNGGLSRGISTTSGGVFADATLSGGEQYPMLTQTTLRPGDLEGGGAGLALGAGVSPEAVAGALARLTTDTFDRDSTAGPGRPRAESNASATSSVSSRRETASGLWTPSSVSSSGRRGRGASGSNIPLSPRSVGGVSPTFYGGGRPPLFNAWSSGRNPVTGTPSRAPPQLSIGSFAAPTPGELAQQSGPALLKPQPAPTPVPPEHFGTPVSTLHGRGRGMALKVATQDVSSSTGHGVVTASGAGAGVRRSASSNALTPTSPTPAQKVPSPQAPPIDDQGWEVATARRGKKGGKSGSRGSGQNAGRSKKGSR